MDGKVVVNTGHSASGCEQAGTDVTSTSIGSLQQQVIVQSTDSEKTLVRYALFNIQLTI
jgi:hypothetical protein